jgi:hypothetical protein
MQIKTKTGRWKYFDNKKTVGELTCYDSYEKHSLYDVRVFKIETIKTEVVMLNEDDPF